MLKKQSTKIWTLHCCILPDCMYSVFPDFCFILLDCILNSVFSRFVVSVCLTVFYLVQDCILYSPDLLKYSFRLYSISSPTVFFILQICWSILSGCIQYLHILYSVFSRFVELFFPTVFDIFTDCILYSPDFLKYSFRLYSISSQTVFFILQICT